jgi:hypothetical protein
MHEFPTGATRSEVKPEYCEITHQFLERLAERCGLGVRLHGRGNWKKGLPMEDTFNHVVDHLWMWRREGNANDDHLAAAAWGIMVLMHGGDACTQESKYRERATLEPLSQSSERPPATMK